LELQKIQFSTTLLQNESRIHGVYFEPTSKKDVINNFLVVYRNSMDVHKLTTKLNTLKDHEGSEPICITYNDCHIHINKGKAIFDMEYVTSLAPIELAINDAINFFKLYKEYLLKYENCEIRGLIPYSKLNTHKIVKNGFSFSKLLSLIGLTRSS